ncbi:hypothetical protein BN7_6349 [Wickerhamomyces ciferrii]|uniref:(S)-ureidoglycine aminohydrolase cupin domain-containing protein n=1 Tax=Wickerhamomyces ciferrii (strain ATCC 14091 / BCRC 22168 / CBS 111 / JCM 3599 / NBRC 0793 / NRRL Y-1031 F-60-10) TaxID=1206466 RepID=K0KU96_WICCF|nr:uncharacterized protein BN7_6349 [Wickerhamomyces ciferrii]CCH46751.1 hypothetical protein BN7_6349 [Wickerhamomyces ciferrii]
MPLTYKKRSEAYEVTPPQIAPNSFLGDVIASETSKEEQITGGFYKVIPGEPLTYTYGYDELKIVLEVNNGTFTVTDEEGTTVDAKPGDVLYFKKGSTITFKVEGGEDAYAYNFYAGKKYFGQV